MSGLGLIVSVIVIAAIWQRLCAIRRMPMDHETVVAYLDRVGVPAPLPVTRRVCARCTGRIS